MSYDLVGLEDDDFGAIGADELEDLIGEDEDDEFAGDADDLLEALSVSGDGTSEIVGADLIGARRRRQRRARRARKAKALRRIVARGSKAVVRRSPDTSRRYPLGFVVTAIGAGATVQIPAAPQDLFRGERITIPSNIAFGLGVVDLKVGNRSQLVQSVEIPAAVFSEVAVYTGLMLDTAEIGNQISIQVRNATGAAITFTAAVVGTVAK